MQPPEQGSCLPLDRDAWCQNGGGSGSGWLWWVRRCWNSFHVVVKVWTSQGVMRSHSSRVCRGGLLRIVQVVVPGSNRSEERRVGKERRCGWLGDEWRRYEAVCSSCSVD